jgi:NAD(P)-dependent dehydrogenase (short-subunit alcohol dehydrogenase family)
MAVNILENKVAIVTGGTRGIGKAIAERLLAERARVAICGTRQKSVDEAVRVLSAKGAVFGMAADIRRIEDVRQFVAAVQQRFDTVHILINNAGVGAFASVAETTPETWEAVIGVNLTGVYYCCHEILPIFLRAGGGDVVNIGSLAGTSAFAGGAAYNASKFGLIGFSEAMMLDHRHNGVRVSMVLPGSVNTEFGRSSAPAGHADTESQDKNTWKIAPEEIAETVVNLLHMPARTTVSRVEVRPSRPPGKT